MRNIEQIFCLVVTLKVKHVHWEQNIKTRNMIHHFLIPPRSFHLNFKFHKQTQCTALMDTREPHGGRQSMVTYHE